MAYRCPHYLCEATSMEGLTQQVALSYLRHGYWWFVTGIVPERKAYLDLGGSVSILQLQNGTLWVATSTGISSFQDGEWNAIENLPASIGTSVNVMDEDRSGRIWIGTMNGVAVLQSGKWSVVTTEGSPLYQRDVIALQAASDGSVWVATTGVHHQLAQFSDDKWIEFGNPTPAIFKDHKMVTGLAVLDSGEVWVATAGSGVFRRTDGKWTRLSEETTGVKLDHTTCLAVSDDGSQAWFGTPGDGLIRFQRGEWTHFSKTDTYFPWGHIFDVALSRDGTMWAGGHSYLARYRRGEWKFYTEKTFPFEPGNEHDVVWEISANEGDEVWVRTLNKLIRLHEPSGSMESGSWILVTVALVAVSLIMWIVLRTSGKRNMRSVDVGLPTHTIKSDLSPVPTASESGPMETSEVTTSHRYDALISYRKQDPDNQFARDLLHKLEADGYRVAIDGRDFDPSQTFLEEMERCIKESRFTLAVMSPRYLESGNCVEEVIICKVLDMGERRRRIVPLVIEQVTMPTWLYDIVGVDFADADPIVDPYERTKQALGNPM